jgi:hypothetical protein
MPLRRHVEALHPFLNWTRLHETIATDTMFPLSKDLSGAWCAQVFYGLCPHVIDDFNQGDPLAPFYHALLFNDFYTIYTKNYNYNHNNFKVLPSLLATWMILHALPNLCILPLFSTTFINTAPSCLVAFPELFQSQNSPESEPKLGTNRKFSWFRSVLVVLVPFLEYGTGTGISQ